MKSLQYPLSLKFCKQYIEFHSIKLWLKYALINNYYNILKTDRRRWMVELNTGYFSHFSR
jgi:hypothetical protein